MYFVVQGEVELLNADRKGFVILGPKEYFGVERDVSYNGHRSESAISKSQ
jgi:CRP-like cAMP-binding protein